jgi:hypothetical protein
VKLGCLTVRFGDWPLERINGSIVIEHEDRMFESSEELVTQGFHLARDVLPPYVV